MTAIEVRTLVAMHFGAAIVNRGPEWALHLVNITQGSAKVVAELSCDFADALIAEINRRQAQESPAGQIAQEQDVYGKDQP